MPSELEARLLADWNLETVDAYGAELRAQGHPRGELIAIDLVLAKHPSRAVRDALAEEKQALHVAWFGEIGENIRSQFGFVEDIRDEYEAILSIIDVVAPVSRRIDLWGENAELRELVARLGAAPRPWLGELELRNFSEQTEVTIDNALSRRLIEATPRLHTLKLDGHLVLDEFPHPGVTRAILQGHDAIGALRGRGVLPNVTTLDFTLHPDFYIHREPPPQALRGGLVHRDAFPRLEVLDVSRNEPRERVMAPNCFAGKTSIWEVLPHVAILPHVTTLRVPSVRDLRQAQQLQTALARTPQLRVLEVARMYNTLLGTPTHPRAQIEVPPPVPWPPGTELREYDALLFRVGDEWIRVELDDAYEVCETRYAAMPRDQQLAWDALWQLVAALGHDDQTARPFAMTTLSALFEAIAVDTHHWWNELAKKVDGSTDATIQIRRIDGYENTGASEPETPRVAASSERLDEHERALQEHWDLDRLAVYADDLQELGDARGELIALDLRHARDPDYELDYQRDELHDQVFGTEYEVKSQLGFSNVDVSSWGDDRTGFERVFVGDVARYLRELELGGPVEHVEADLVRLTSEPRPWLRTVRIETMSELELSTVDWPTVAAAWPNLEQLDLAINADTPHFHGFVHPKVHTLRMTALNGFARLGAPWPAVRTLDIAFNRDVDDVRAIDQRYLTHARFPALTTLDLSRNEPQVGGLDRDTRYQGHADLFAIFARLEDALLARLTHVRLPSPRNAAHVALIQSALDRMPALAVLEIVRRYPRGPEVALSHPTAQLVIPTVSPWPPLDQVQQGTAWTIEKQPLSVATAVTSMENHFATLSAAGRQAWTQLWPLLGDPGQHSLRVSALTLHAAVDALLDPDTYTYEKYATALHSLALAEATITITRTTD